MQRIWLYKGFGYTKDWKACPKGQSTPGIAVPTTVLGWSYCPLALRGNPGVFALGASVDPALGRIGGAAVRGRATGAHPELVQSAIKCH